MKSKKKKRPKKKSISFPEHPDFIKEHKKLFEMDISKDNKKWNEQFRKVCILAKMYEGK